MGLPVCSTYPRCCRPAEDFVCECSCHRGGNYAPSFPEQVGITGPAHTGAKNILRKKKVQAEEKLLYRASDECAGLKSRPQDPWKYLAQIPDKPFAVYDYSFEKDKTRLRIVDEVLQHWKIPACK